MFNFFKKKQNQVEIPEVKPMNIWEENSFMHVISDSVEKYTLDGCASERIKAIPGVKLIDFNFPKPDVNGNMVIEYKGEEYGVGFYFDNFEMNALYSVQKQKIPDDEFEGLQDKTKSFIVFMKFHKDPLASYHLQLKLLEAFFPDMQVVLDESAERLLSGKWVRLAAASEVLPNAEALFTVQAVTDDNDEKVWLHTHGMNRAGFSELEVLDVNKDDVNNQYYLINTTANRVLYENKEIGDYIFLGEFLDGDPIVVTSLPWNKGLEKYSENIVGGAADRLNGHNTNSSLLFLYLTEDDADNQAYTKPTVLNSKLEDNPLYYYTNTQTEQMKLRARERFHILENAMKSHKDDYYAMIKIGLPTQDEEGNTDYENLEHIWFELLEFVEDGFRALLIQKPYRVPSMKEGDEGRFTIEDVTDWIIRVDDMTIDPNTAYLL